MDRNFSEFAAEAEDLHQLMQRFQKRFALGQRELATLLDCKRSSLSMAMNGRRGLSNRALICLVKLAQAVIGRPLQTHEVREHRLEQCRTVKLRLQQRLLDLKHNRKLCRAKLARLRARHRCAQTKYELYNFLLFSSAADVLDVKARLWARMELKKYWQWLENCGPVRQLPLVQRIGSIRGELAAVRRQLAVMEGMLDE